MLPNIEGYDFVVNPSEVAAFLASDRIYYPLMMTRFISAITPTRVSLERTVDACIVWHTGSVDDFLQQDDHFAVGYKQRFCPDHLVGPLIWMVATHERFASVKRAIILLPDAQVCFVRNTRPGKSYVHLLPKDANLHQDEYVVGVSSTYEDLEVQEQYAA